MSAGQTLESAEHDYLPGNGIVLRLSQSDLTSLAVVLRAALDEAGIKMSHEEIVERRDDFHSESHLAKLVNLYRRVDAALHGRRTWNAEWRFPVAIDDTQILALTQDASRTVREYASDALDASKRPAQRAFARERCAAILRARSGGR